MIFAYSDGKEVNISTNDSVYLSYDFETSAMHELEYRPIHIQKDYLISRDENGDIIVKSAGEDEMIITNETVVGSEWCDGYRVIDGYLFNESDGFAYELDSGEIVKINAPGTIIAKYKGAYICRSGSSDYVKLTKSELFAD